MIRSWTFHPALLACGLTLLIALPASAGAEYQAPALAEMPAANLRVAPLIARYQADLASLEHVHDTLGAPRREAALREFHQAWQARLSGLDETGLGNEDRIDLFLLQRHLARELRELEFEAGRYREAAALLPGMERLLALLEARRALEYPQARSSAETLDGVRRQISALSGRIESGATDLPSRDPVVAYRAARWLESTRESLREWYEFHAGYDPQFTWWAKQPYEALAQALERHAKALRDKLAGAADPETIVGDPIGRAALLAGLEDQLIPYTPEQLIEFAETELAWCQQEMQKAAAEMGFADWRQALEAVKNRHVEPGEQPRLVVQLADEAVAFLDERELVTVPEQARRDWRMTMLSPEYQLQAPFFLGGEDVWVAYPTDGMPLDKKLNALRGNNRHFSRAVVHHELIPGHHLQHYYNGRHNTQRQLFDTPFWTEGWALYWELRLWDLGFARSPEDRIGMLFWRSHRAARILFSLSFHLGRMSTQQAIEMLVTRVGHERENAAAEVRRSFQGDYGPLYQIAYLVGGWQFRALHEEMVVPGGMSERQFHDAILQGGPMPVSLVRDRLQQQAPRAPWRFRN
jgi:uncharacterized protein (DUF885 family)